MILNVINYPFQQCQNMINNNFSDAQIRQVEEQKKGLDVQRNFHLSEYQRKVEDKKENQKQYQIEQKETMNQLVAKKAENQVEQSSQLLNQIRSNIDFINISTQAAAQGTHEFVYMDMDGLINILKVASEPKGLIDKVQFWQPNLNKPRVDEAANLVINSCDTAMRAVNALNSACSNGDSTIRMSASGISAEKRKEYLKHINGLSDICRQLKQLVSKAKLYAELRSSVKDIEDLKKALEGEIKKLTEATRELPMLYHENKLEETLQKFKENIKHSTEEMHRRSKQTALESKSQMQSIQGAADTQMQGQEKQDEPDEHAHQD
ncbi:hypothetical protein WR25_23311 [Diploscapter pachys]|uniref:Uncharacterized protein n=1 Tax=Diploscapter pachys TaxID=2018661 RepID=A0A2A2J7V0_9BILA|nr:hypothetical protein WR25_23311 [Diploscapter pachys]